MVLDRLVNKVMALERIIIRIPDGSLGFRLCTLYRPTVIGCRRVQVNIIGLHQFSFDANSYEFILN
jgi:hypothetical protein